MLLRHLSAQGLPCACIGPRVGAAGLMEGQCSSYPHLLLPKLASKRDVDMDMDMDKKDIDMLRIFAQLF